MYETAVWATDGSPAADGALREALRLAEPNGGRIVAVRCDQHLSSRSSGWPAFADEQEGRAKVRRQSDELRSDGIVADLVVLGTHGEAADTVADLAEDFNADAIVSGTRRRSAFAGALLGSFSHRTLHVARCAVVAVPQLARATAGADT